MQTKPFNALSIMSFAILIFSYINNIPLASCDEREHFSRLCLVFQPLADYGLTINPKKCVFGFGLFLVCFGPLYRSRWLQNLSEQKSN